jgi:hypothetical protein
MYNNIMTHKKQTVSLWLYSWNYTGTWVKTIKRKIIHPLSQLHSNITCFIKINLSWTSSIAEGILTCLIFQEIDLVSSSGDWLHCTEIFVLLVLLFFISYYSCHSQIHDYSGMNEAKLANSEVIHVRFLPVPSSMSTYQLVKLFVFQLKKNKNKSKYISR